MLRRLPLASAWGVVFFVYVFSQICFAADEPHVLRVGTSEQWRALLLYSKRFLRGESSLIDSREFFLDKDGKTNPVRELEETLSRFRKEETQQTNDKLLRCRFPARYYFLKTVFDDLSHDISKCEWIQNYLILARPERVSLTFSSFFINNPASMMGHTFLRFRRSIKPGEINSPYLDYAVNFAANPTTSNQLLYAAGGLSGFFPGTFTLTPYHIKIAEYVNFESRDLWEYDLRFSQEEVYRLFLSVLEVGQHQIDYFYLDENCSYIMLFLLDAVRPALKLSRHFRSVVAPTDTVIAIEESGLVEKVGFIPSQRSKFLYFYDKLDSFQKEAIRIIVDFRPSGDLQQRLEHILAGFSEFQKVEIIDVTLDYIDYAEKIAGDRQPEKFRDLYKLLLRMRTRYDLQLVRYVPAPHDLAPHRAHNSKQLSGGYDIISSRNGDILTRFLTAGFRFNFHDVDSPAGGFPFGLGIELGKVKVAYEIEAKTVHLLAFMIAEIFSLQEQGVEDRTPSWRLGIGYESVPHPVDEKLTLRGAYYFRVGLGLTRFILKNRLIVSVFAIPEIYYGEEVSLCCKRIGAQFTVGPEFLLRIVEKVGASGSFHIGRSFEWGNESLFKKYYTGALRLYLDRSLEADIRYRFENSVNQFEGQLLYYF